MRKIVVSEFVSMDGVTEDPGGSEGTARGGWAFKFNRGPDGDKFKLDEVMGSTALLLGRRTYEGFAQAWPSRTDEVGFAQKMNSMPKFVVSSTLKDPEWNNTTVVRVDDLPRLKQDSDGDMLVNGSNQLVHALNDRGLVDELRLMVFPIVLGDGKRLFGSANAERSFRLVEARPVGSDGVLVLVYEPKR